MKIAVMGAGGIGTYLGGLLAHAGHDVALIGRRGPHVEAMRQSGLIVETRGRARCVRVAATDDPAQLGPVDVVIVSVKQYDLEQAARGIRPIVGSGTMVVPIQNGVTSHETLERILGPGHALGGTVFISAMLGAPGVVTGRSKIDKLVFGEIDGVRSTRATAFQQACRDAGIDAVLSTDIISDLWAKFVTVAGTSAICALARRSVDQVCADERLRALMVQAMHEVIDVARAKAIFLPADTVAAALAFNRSVAPGTRISLLEDLERGKRLELDWLSGHVLRQGEALGVPTPLHAIAYACLCSSADNAKPR